MRNVCTVDACSEYVVGQGLCRKHYMRKRRTGSISDVRKNARGVCSEPGCGGPHRALGLCDKHYRQQLSKPALATVSADCRWCGSSFEKTVTNRRKVFCSRKCKVAASNSRRDRDFREYHLKRKFGISLDDYGRMLNAQGGVCGICGASEPGGKHNTMFMVDHDHETGAVRGLLCGNCNTGLGMLRDDPVVLRSAAEYLESHVLVP